MSKSFRFRIEDTLYPALVLVLVLIAWESSGRLGLVAQYILPPPSAILSKLTENYAVLFYHAGITAAAILLGFIFAVVTGMMLALAIVFVRPFEKAFMPWIIATQAIPKVAMAPLIIIWFGFGLLPKVLISGTIAFFPIMIGTVVGLRSIEREVLYMLQSMGANAVKAFWYAQLPNGLPSIFAGMKVGMVLASVGAIVGEFVGSNNGLGYVLITANGLVDTQLLFAALFLIAVLATGLYAIVHVAERLLLGWHVSIRDDVSAATT